MKNYDHDEQLKEWLSSYNRKKPSAKFVENVMQQIEYDSSVIYKKKFIWKTFWNNFLSLFLPMLIILGATGYYFYQFGEIKFTFKVNFYSTLNLIHAFMNEIINGFSTNPLIFIGILAIIALLFTDKILTRFIHSL